MSSSTSSSIAKGKPAPKNSKSKKPATVKDPTNSAKGKTAKDGAATKDKTRQVRGVNDISVRGPIMGRHTKRGLVRRYGGDASIFFPYIMRAFRDYTAGTGKIMYISREAVLLIDSLLQHLMTRLFQRMKHIMPDKGSLNAIVVTAAMSSISPSKKFSSYMLERIKFHQKYAEKKSPNKSPFDAYFGSKVKRVPDDQEKPSSMERVLDPQLQDDMDDETLEPYNLNDDSDTDDDDDDDEEEAQQDDDSSSDSEDEQQSSSSSSSRSKGRGGAQQAEDDE